MQGPAPRRARTLGCLSMQSRFDRSPANVPLARSEGSSPAIGMSPTRSRVSQGRIDERSCRLWHPRTGAWAVALVRHRRRGAGCGRLPRRQGDRAMRIAGKVEAIVRSRQDEARYWAATTSLAHWRPHRRTGETSLTGRSCAGFGRPVIVSNTVVIVDVFGSLYAARGQRRTLDKRRESRASAPVSRSGLPPLSGLAPASFAVARGS
jgi:hypothetical protein